MVRAVDHVLAALAGSGRGSCSWLVGEPCFPPPEVLCEALADAARSGRFPYPPQAGLPGLREVLAERHGEGDRSASPDQVIITTGAKGGLLAVMAALLEPGDEVIHPQPSYPAYREMARRLGANPVAVAENHGSFEGWPQRVAECVGPRTRAVIVASPSNPSGATLTADQARQLVDVCRLKGLRLICDEAYAEFRFAPGCSKVPADFDRDRETVVQIRSASKSWALCGWRLGWVVANTHLAARVAAVHAALFNPAPGPTQAALQRLPEVPAAYLDAARAAVQRRLSELAAALQAAGLHAAPPAGGFYLWLDGRRLIDRYGADGPEQLCVVIARHSGVGLWPGSDFGSAEHLRIAATAPADTTWESSRERLQSALSRRDAAGV